MSTDYSVTADDSPRILAAKIKRIESEIQYLQHEFDCELRNLAYSNGRKFSETSGSRTNIHVDTVANLAISLADGHIPEVLVPLRQSIDKAIKRKKATELRLCRIEEWLSALSDVERYSVEKHLFDRLSWQDCEDESANEKFISVSTMKRHFKAAMSRTDDFQLKEAI